MTFAGFAQPPAVDAHRRLVEAALAEYLKVPISYGENPPHGSPDRLWREAEQVQRRILGGWDVEARDAIERLVQHVLRLAGRAEWFQTDIDRRRLAIEEMIVYEAYGWTVASQEAQVKWRHVWLASRTHLGETLDDGELRTVDLLEGDWLSAWGRWLRSAP